MGVLRSTRAYSLRNTSPARLAALAGALAVLGIKPDFGFLYSYAQVRRQGILLLQGLHVPCVADRVVASPGVEVAHQGPMFSSPA